MLSKRTIKMLREVEARCESAFVKTRSIRGIQDYVKGILEREIARRAKGPAIDPRQTVIPEVTNGQV
jgi:hypothetical protein